MLTMRNMRAIITLAYLYANINVEYYIFVIPE